MDYQSLYNQYQNALKLRELSIDDNYQLLREIFNKKIIAGLSIDSQNNLIAYLAGIRDVFSYVENESARVNDYREELDKSLSDKDSCF